MHIGVMAGCFLLKCMAISITNISYIKGKIIPSMNYSVEESFMEWGLLDGYELELKVHT